MIKKLVVILTLMASLALCLFAAASCSGDGSHEHTFSEEWSFDEAEHWHAATCGHTTRKADKAKHTVSEDFVVAALPTISEAGLKTKSCTVCGAVIESEVIPAYKDDYNYTGNGTFEEPYAIRNRTDLHYIRQKDGEGVYFAICNDIDLSGAPFEPFEDFYGNLDGGNCYIYNFYSLDGNFENIGFFRQNHGVIANVKMASSDENKKCYIDVTTSFETVRCGMLVGDNYGDVHNCSLENAELKVLSQFDPGANKNLNVYIGGLVGYCSAGKIERCYSVNSNIYGKAYREGLYYSAITNLGGVVGGNNSEVSHCFAYGNSIKGVTDGAVRTDAIIRLGGVIGVIHADSSATALIGYDNSFEYEHHRTYTTMEASIGQAVGRNEGSMKFVYSKYGEEIDFAGVKGTNIYCEQIDLSHITEMPIFMEEGCWTVITDEETGEYQVAFNEKSNYKFEKTR